MTPNRLASLCVLLSLARSSGDFVYPEYAPVTVTPGTYYKHTEKFSVITKDDCHIAAHDTYSSVAVGGSLYDASCGQDSPIDTKNSGQLPYVTGNIGVDEGSCCSGSFCFGSLETPYSQDCQNCGGFVGNRAAKFRIQGYYATSLPFDWESFEDMVCAMPEGSYSDGSFRVYVIDQGSDQGYDPSGTVYGGTQVGDGMNSNAAQYNTDTRGCIVVYKGSNSVVLSNGGNQNNKWVCSVLAPFATILYNGRSQQSGGPGYIDGNIVARTFTATDRDSSTGQLHGYPYQGSFPTLLDGLSCSGKPGYGLLNVSPPPPSLPPSVPPPIAPEPPLAPPPPRWGAQHCITNADTGKHACVVLPLGHDINSDTDPTVKRAKDLAFRLEPMGNTQYTPPSD